MGIEKGLRRFAYRPRKAAVNPACVMTGRPGHPDKEGTAPRNRDARVKPAHDDVSTARR